MISHCNFHTHTNFSDGKLSAEEMTLAAVARGMDALGFSDHGSAPFDWDYSIRDFPGYISEITRLREKYAPSIELYIGVEQDFFSEPPPDGLDYIIGAAHYVETKDGYRAIDADAKDQHSVVNTYFGGDYYAMCEAYYDVVAGVAEKWKPDFIAHFDLVTKHNISGMLFDETHPRYRGAAVAAMERILRTCHVFEVNTNAVFRLGKPAPYPSFYLLKELLARGGEVILSSDSHVAENLCFAFPEMEDMLCAVGYKYVKRLTKNGFVDVPL